MRKNHALAAAFIDQQDVKRAESRLQAVSGAVWSVFDDVWWSDSSPYKRSIPGSNPGPYPRCFSAAEPPDLHNLVEV